MANNPKLSVARRNAALDAIFDVLDGGYVDLYDGTQPATTETSISGPVKLARNSLNATFAPAASSATKTANSIASSTALATGTATWATFVTSGGARVLDVSVGTSSADVIMASVTIQQDATVSYSSCVITMAAG